MSQPVQLVEVLQMMVAGVVKSMSGESAERAALGSRFNCYGCT